MKKIFMTSICLSLCSSIYANSAYEHECKNADAPSAQQLKSCEKWLNDVQGNDVEKEFSALYHYSIAQMTYANNFDLVKLERAYQLAKEHKNHAWMILVGNILSDGYISYGKTELSMNLLGEILAEVSQNQNVNDTLNYLYLIERYGNTLILMKEYEKAQAPLQISIEHILPIREDGMRNIILLNNYALLLEKSKHYQKASIYYMQANRLIKQLGLSNLNTIQMQKNYADFLKEQNMTEEMILQYLKQIEQEINEKNSASLNNMQ